MAFDRPAALLLLVPLLPLILAGAWRSRASLPPRRLTGSAAVRIMLSALAILALAAPRLPMSPATPRPIVYLVDVSDSIPLAARESARHRIIQLAKEADPDAEQWLIAFAGGAVSRPLVDPAALDADASLRELLLFPAAEAEARRALERTGNEPGPPAGTDGSTSETTLRRIARLRHTLEPDETDLRAALRALGGLPPSGRTPDIVLFTDGRLTRRFGPDGWSSLRETAGRLVLADTGGIDPGIAVRAVIAPPHVDAGQPFDIVVRFTARGGESARIRLLVDDRPSGDSPHACVAGVNVATLPHLRIEEPGLHRLKVIVAAEGDPEPRNNVGIALVHVGTPPEVLLVEGRRGLAAHLEGALQVQGIRSKRTEAAALPDRRDAYASYAAVGLVGVAADQILSGPADALRQAVEADGVGLLFVGDPHLAGSKSLRGHPLERILPVAFQPYDPPPPPGAGKPPDPAPPTSPPPPDAMPKPVAVEASAIALCLLVDKSGSMAGDNIRLAKEAAIAAAETLEKGDSVAVIAFDTNPRLVLETTPATRMDFIRDRIARIQADGGTNVYPALLAAYQLLRNNPAQARHVIVMSDGITQIADYRGLLNQMRADRITVSSVCVAADLTFDWTLMHNLAAWGGGRFYPALSFKEVPQIFTKETRVLVDRRTKERAARQQREKALADATRPSSPARPPSPKPDTLPSPPPEIPLRIASEEEAVRNFEDASLPPVGGLLPAAAREATSICVASDEDRRPALVLGRFGLGHTAAWLADWADGWGRRWISWKRFPAFSAQLVRSLLRRGPANPFPGMVSAEFKDGSARVSVDFQEAAEKEDGRYVVVAAWTCEKGPEHPIALSQTAPFVVSGTFPSPPAGKAALVHVVLSNGTRTWRAPPVGIARAYPEELGGTIGSAFVEAGETGIPPAIPSEQAALPPLPPTPAGKRSVPMTAPLLAVALMLLPVDIALRRLRL